MLYPARDRGREGGRGGEGGEGGGLFIGRVSQGGWEVLKGKGWRGLLSMASCPAGSVPDKLFTVS